MAKDENLVIYNNRINEELFEGFKLNEMKFFLAICIKVRDGGPKRVISSFDEIKKLCRYKRKISDVEFCKEVEDAFSKISKLQYSIRYGGTLSWINLFAVCTVDSDNKEVIVTVNKQFTFMFNEITENFSVLKMSDLAQINSLYSLHAYRLFKQYESTGYIVRDLDQIKKLLCIPDSYENKEINRRIISKIEKELQEYFYELKIEKKSKNSRNKDNYTVKFRPSKIKKTQNNQKSQKAKCVEVEKMKEMDELEARLQKKLYEKIIKKELEIKRNLEISE